MVQKEFIETSSRNWTYLYTDIMDINEADGFVDVIPPNAVAYLILQSKYSSIERGGWMTHTERVFLNNDGTFTSDGYDKVLSKVLPTWLMMTSCESIMSQED